MDKIAKIIVEKKKTIIIIFIMATIVCSVLQLFVTKNFNMVDYLPENAPSTQALKIMNKEFTASIPNTNVMIKDVSLMEAMEYKKKLLDLDYVSSVLWLDDVVDIKVPLELHDKSSVEGFYKNQNALFSVTVDKGKEKEACASIREVIGTENFYSGEAPDLVSAQEGTGSEVAGAFLILVPAILLILFLFTKSWAEPILFIMTIGISIMLNMGTNIFLGQISFMTASISPILQMAVSLDYAIFLLHSFADNRKIYPDVDVAMRKAIKSSILTVSSSALTTLFGFIALMFMKFEIGADLGLNLAKGIIFSFITTVVFLPTITLSFYKFIDKTTHRNFTPEFENIHKILSKIGIPVLIFVFIFIAPSYLAQSKTGFVYGSAEAITDSDGARGRKAIEEEFGKSTINVLLVPKGNIVKELEMANEIKNLNHITNVTSYATMVGTVIPKEFLDEEIINQFYSENYSRIIIYASTKEEGDIAFDTISKIKEISAYYYGAESYLLGQSATLYDMRDVVAKDNTFVNIIAIVAIFMVLLLSFKSISMPIILLITIEFSIWLNLSFTYFSGSSINFIGYLILCTVQLGATVDYAILLTDNYIKNRKTKNKKESMYKAMGSSFKSILVSALTLTISGFALYFTSSNAASASIGLLLGRGTILSFVMVVCALPTMLTFFDETISKTTLKSNFL